MSWLRESWSAFFFRRSTPVDLGICRILFFGLVLLHFSRWDASLWGEVPSVFWMPTPFFRWLDVPVLPSQVLAMLNWVWRVALALSCIGLFTRSSTAVAFIAGAYLLGLPHNFGKVHHSDTVVFFGLAVLAFSRCGHAWSIDALCWARRAAEEGKYRERLSGEYTWPIRAIWVLIALIYFAAGVSKLRHSGLGWIFSENITNVLLEHHYTGHKPPFDLGLQLAQSTWLPALLAGVTVTLEVGAPLALFRKRLRAVIVPGLFLLQSGIWVVLGVPFHAYLICFLFFVPWESIGRRLRLGTKFH